ncbi:meiotic nuclear division protein 1 homolog [Ischnura elegans]|uniref:meiotic nuclear division protein 1 homolog n=1 Tax=Ischnura elegans TaxID=197161 RepID=UPI001ED878C6|nr:meiotic nuclear division protein 1 homolog [Ischnura elegans]XP_046389926.1 meiotic nuclear division protein 1 homolog [Ischnura elegans]XP_046389927.1 meiotic nuclear division protein 1 homolog [Ischnura elegans]XP_046389928.1 meiotic nuclear division protein 1 homolog [Ischnura elegans]
MSKRKGLSAEEKRKKMLEIFHESLEFYQLKELEKIAPKQKGIISQSVKDVIQSLVDDGLVDTDKIGTSVYYWSYPSKTRKTKERILEQKKTQLVDCKKKLKMTLEAVEKAKMGREESEQRNHVLHELSEKKVVLGELSKEKQQYHGKDPKTMKLLKEQTQIAKDATNRWIDNIFILKHWCVNRFNIEEDKLNREFGIDSELDYIN